MSRESRGSMVDQDEGIQDDAKGVAVVGGPTRRPTGSSARERGAKRQSGAPALQDGVDEADGTPGEGQSSLRPRGLPMRASIALATLAVAAMVSAVVFGVLWGNLNAQNQERQAVNKAATTFVLDLFNYRPTTVDAVFDDLQNFAASGSLFAKQAAQTLNSNIRQDLIKAQAYSQGQIRDIFVESLNGANAQVYAVVDQAYQNSKIPSPITDTLRMTINMTDTAQGWRVSAVTVENPSGAPSVPSGSTPTTAPPGK